MAIEGVDSGDDRAEAIVDLPKPPKRATSTPRRSLTDHRFRLAVDASPAAMIMVDANGVIEFANAETVRMFGYAIDELLGKSIDILAPSRSRSAHAALRQGFFAHPSKRPMGAGRDLYGTRKDGTESRWRSP